MDLQRGLRELTVATQLDGQRRYHEAVAAYRRGIALLYLAYADDAQGAATKELLLSKIAEYQRRADQLAHHLAASTLQTAAMTTIAVPSGPPLPSASATSSSSILPHAQPTSSTSYAASAAPSPSVALPSPQLDIPRHVLNAFSGPVSQHSSRQTSGQSVSQGHHFADEEDQALLERVMKLRVDATSTATNQTTTSATGLPTTGDDVEREYRERINKLAGREVIADPARPTRSLLDVEELTEEEEIDRVLNAVHDDVRLDVLGGGRIKNEKAETSDEQKTKTKTKKKRTQRRASDSETDSDESDYSDDLSTDTSDGDSDEESATARKRRKARMERERNLTFGERWELRKKERERTKDGGEVVDPLKEREKAFMAKKEQEERDKQRKYRAEFLKNYGKFV